MDLNNELKIVNKYCSENEIILIPVGFENQDTSNFFIEWEGDLHKYLEFLNSSCRKYLFMDKYIVSSEQYELRIKNLEIYDPNLEKEIFEILNEIKKKEGMVFSFSLMFTIDGNNVFYNSYANENENFFKLIERFKETADFIEKDKIEDHYLRYYERKKLMKSFAKDLATHPDYRKTLIRDDEQNALIDKVLGNKPFHLEGYDIKVNPMMEFILRRDIRELAKAHFKIHIEPKLDKEFIDKIREWKKQEMTKVEMGARLEISRDKLNQLYYKS